LKSFSAETFTQRRLYFAISFHAINVSALVRKCHQREAPALRKLFEFD